MANYYLAFSKTLGIENNDEYEWLKSKLDELSKAEPGDDDWKNDFCYRFEKNDKDQVVAIWFFTEENGEPSHVADLVQAFLKRFDKKYAWAMEWSNWCDKPRIDAYGGGAVVVTAKKQVWMNTGRWSDEQVKKMTDQTDEEKWALIRAHQKKHGADLYPTKALRSWAEKQKGKK